MSKFVKTIMVWNCLFLGIIGVAQAQTTYPSGLTEAQARKAVSPYVRQATDCIANYMMNNQYADALYAQGNYYSVLIDDALKACQQPLMSMVTALDANYYTGHGMTFFKGAYLSDLQRAVDTRVAPVMQNRLADKRKQDEYKNQLQAHAEKQTKEKNDKFWGCLVGNVEKTYNQSQETAKTIAKSALIMCNSDMNDYYNSFLSEPNKSLFTQSDKNTFKNSDMEKTTEALAAVVIQYRSTPPSKSNTPTAEKTEERKSSGSAFVINSQGHIVTNHHVINGCKPPIQTTLGEAKIISEDSNNDIAVLKIDNLKAANYALFRSSSLNMGEQIYALGYPLSSILNNGLNITDGKVSSLSGINNNTNYLQFTAPVQPGNSGGPLVDSSGQVIGMVTLRLDDITTFQQSGSLPQNLNFALRNDIITGILKAKDIPYNTSNRFWTKDAPSVAKAAKEYTVQVICTVGKK